MNRNAKTVTAAAAVVVAGWHVAAHENMVARGCPFLRAVGLRPEVAK